MPLLPATAYRVGRSKTGLGLFATERIKKGAKIIRYFGPLLDSKKEDEDAIENKYLFQIDKRWTIDGSVRENIARYINHSCKPNAESDVKVRKRMVIIRAIKNIEPGDEINYDYGTEYFKAYLKPIGCKCDACEKKRAKKELKKQAKQDKKDKKAAKKAGKKDKAKDARSGKGKASPKPEADAKVKSHKQTKVKTKSAGSKAETAKKSGTTKAKAKASSVKSKASSAKGIVTRPAAKAKSQATKAGRNSSAKAASAKPKVAAKKFKAVAAGKSGRHAREARAAGTKALAA